MTIFATRSLRLDATKQRRVNLVNGVPSNFGATPLRLHEGDWSVFRVSIVDGSGDAVALDAGADYLFRLTTDHNTYVAQATTAAFNVAGDWPGRGAGQVSFRLDLTEPAIATALGGKASVPCTCEMWYRGSVGHWQLVAAFPGMIFDTAGAAAFDDESSSFSSLSSFSSSLSSVSSLSSDLSSLSSQSSQPVSPYCQTIIVSGTAGMDWDGNYIYRGLDPMLGHLWHPDSSAYQQIWGSEGAWNFGDSSQGLVYDTSAAATPTSGGWGYYGFACGDPPNESSSSIGPSTAYCPSITVSGTGTLDADVTLDFAGVDVDGLPGSVWKFPFGSIYIWGEPGAWYFGAPGEPPTVWDTNDGPTPTGPLSNWNEYGYECVDSSSSSSQSSESSEPSESSESSHWLHDLVLSGADAVTQGMAGPFSRGGGTWNGRPYWVGVGGLHFIFWSPINGRWELTSGAGYVTTWQYWPDVSGGPAIGAAADGHVNGDGDDATLTFY